LYQAEKEGDRAHREQGIYKGVENQDLLERKTGPVSHPPHLLQIGLGDVFFEILPALKEYLVRELAVPIKGLVVFLEYAGEIGLLPVQPGKNGGSEQPSVKGADLAGKMPSMLNATLVGSPPELDNLIVWRLTGLFGTAGVQREQGHEEDGHDWSEPDA
jgi:hypothetical protein